MYLAQVKGEIKTWIKNVVIEVIEQFKKKTKEKPNGIVGNENKLCFFSH